MADEQGKLSRAQTRRMLAELPAKKRLDALLELPQAKLAVQRVPAEDLYVAIAEVGLEDATEIVQLASPEQFQAFVDLAGWTRDRLSSHDVLTWLRAARGDEDEEFRAKLDHLDLEVLELLLRELTVTHDLEEDPDVQPEGMAVETPEGRYLVEIKATGVEASAVRALLNDLIAKDPFQATRLLEAVRWEVPSELEEAAFRFRAARMQDLGFPELYDALSLFAFRDPDGLAPKEAAPAALAAPAAPGEYLEACFRAFAEEERPRFEDELRLLVNSALVAEGADPGDIDALRRVSELARDYLALGLEHVSGGVPAGAADAVRRLGFRAVFQAGFSLGLKLKFRADRLAKRPLFEVDGVPLLLPDEAKAVAALRRKRPLRTVRVEGGEPVPFRSKRELADSAAVLAKAEGEAAVLGALLGGTVERARAEIARFGAGLAEVGADRLWIAAVAQSVLGAPELAPVARDRVPELGRLLFEGEPPALRIRDEARSRSLAALAARAGPEGAELANMVDWALARLRDELGPALLRGSIERATSVILPVSGL